jgi:hypothetical protein
VTRFAFIDREQAHHDVAALCRLLKVSRSVLRLAVPPAVGASGRGRGADHPDPHAFDDNRKVYGPPRIHAELADAGLRVSRKRIARLMRAAEIVGCHRRKRSFSITQQAPHAARSSRGRWISSAGCIPTTMPTVGRGWAILGVRAGGSAGEVHGRLRARAVVGGNL